MHLHVQRRRPRVVVYGQTHAGEGNRGAIHPAGVPVRPLAGVVEVELAEQLLERVGQQPLVVGCVAGLAHRTGPARRTGVKDGEICSCTPPSYQAAGRRRDAFLARGGVSRRRP